MSKVVINEVGLRDGLQNQPRILATDAKLQIFNALTEAGLTSLEVTSFVSPTRVPQLADADAFSRALPHDSRFQISALVASQRGYERARQSGAKRVAVVLAATETLNQRNIGLPITTATRLFEEIIRQARRDGIFARAYIAAAFACPYEGQTPPEVVMSLTDAMAIAGAHEISIADTIGAGHPSKVRPLLTPLLSSHGSEKIAVHFHDTRGFGMALAWSAFEAGVRRFDSSVGGLGGCPFASGASGNIATEDLVFMLNEAGVDTGVDFVRLLDAVKVVRELVDPAAGGRIVAWGLHNFDQQSTTAYG